MRVLSLRELILALTAIVLFAPAVLWAQTNPDIPKKLTLQKTQALLEKSPILRAKKEEIDAERGDIVDAEKYPNPVLSLGTEGLVFDSERGNFIDRLQPSISLRQEFLTAGKREKRRRVEVADAEISSMEADDLRRRLRFELAKVYYSVVLAQRDLEVSREILSQFQDVIDLNRIRFEAGEVSGAELRRTEAAEYSFFVDMVDAEVRLENSRSELLALLGSNNLDQPFEAIDDFDPSFAPPLQSELREMALRQRPDLASERAHVKRSELAIDLEEAQSKPNITAFAGYKRELDADGPVVGIDLPLYLFNKNEGPIQRARALNRRQSNSLLFSRITVLKEVHMALRQLEGVRRRIEALENGFLQKVEEARNITESSYRLGEASLIEFLDAERSYSETRLLYNKALYDFEIGRARLEAAVGMDL